MERTSKTSANVPSLDEAQRVINFILRDEVGVLAEKLTNDLASTESVCESLALTIAVVTAAETNYRRIGPSYPEQWESLERSATTLTDAFVVKWMANADPDLKRAITKNRRRKLTAKAGTLKLVESDRNKRARWAQITLPNDAPIPIAPEVGEGLGEAMHAAEERLYEHLNAAPLTDPLVFAGQVVGLLSAAECLLAMLPSNQVAAFCVHLARASAAAQQ